MNNNSEKKKVFISYAREDTEVAERLYSDLKNAGLKPWMDEKDLLPGQNWELTVTNAIKESSFFLALLSESSVSKKGFVQQELKLALKLLERFSPTDVFIIPLRLDKCRPVDERLQLLHRVDLFRSYEKGLEKVLRVLCSEKESVQINIEGRDTAFSKDSGNAEIVREVVKESKPETESAPGWVYKLRSKPRELSIDDVEAMFAKHNFFADNFNKSGNFKNNFTDNGDGTVTDSVTGLMWEKSGSGYSMIYYYKTQAYIDDLNRRQFAGYNDWRLPTLEELASLLESKRVNDYFIDPVFECRIGWYWSTDKYASGGDWYVYFYNGSVYRYNLDNFNYVRAVRSRAMLAI
ncbi:MAG: TIR domain-containing protein [Desulfobacterales bacterium]|nr:TIR domain-containing protein [Desulfobacterales bacterium]